MNYHKKILLAEDDLICQNIIKLILKDYDNILLDIVDNGLDLLKLVGEKEYDLILMDLRMPTISGFDATKIIRTNNGNNKNTPIIAVTACAMDTEKERCFAMGMNDFIAKPFKLQRLTKTLEKYI